ncbi:alpha/beta hydrolase [Solihabitans fulvus]|uniref:Alpha/beta hydrolase n=1 Tax=Solihabitans fulvus TaxID=1892852 RepID=A0A5B2X8B0_9PSEU|nr:alpha/beta hydrolase [Solihabitans fulvus]KAA2259485.1 alpha/beta hydrolase [Solihabitans fulvus]
MPFLTTNDGTSLFYKDWGSGSPVVFAHSWSLSSQMWQYQMLHLAEHGQRCVALDRRGHGRSDQPWDGYDIDTLADDLAALLDRLDLRGVTLVGHSTGTCEVVRYLSRHGADRVARIVLVSCVTPFMLKTPDNPDGFDVSVFEDSRALWHRDFPLWVAEVAGPFSGVGLPGNQISPALVDAGIADARTVSTRAMIEISHTITETDFRAEMREITVPALVIHGGEDMFNPLDLCGRRSAELIPDSRLEVYEDGPHGLHLTHLDRLNADLLDFVTR